LYEHKHTAYMKKLVIPTLMLALVACGTSKVASTFSQSDVDRGATKFSGLTLAALEKGKIDSETYCVKCHGYKKPQGRTEEQWREIVPRMAKKANSGIDAQTEQSILAYMVTMSKPN